MFGGGNWQSQNKTLPGTYINFISKKSIESNKPSNTNNDADEGTSGGEVTTTIATLGKAILGKMVLN